MDLIIFISHVKKKKIFFLKVHVLAIFINYEIKNNHAFLFKTKI